MGLDARKPVFRVCEAGYGKNKDADQPAHPHSLISPFVIAYRKVSYLDLQQGKFQFSSSSL